MQCGIFKTVSHINNNMLMLISFDLCVNSGRFSVDSTNQRANSNVYNYYTPQLFRQSSNAWRKYTIRIYTIVPIKLITSYTNEESIGNDVNTE